jgi:O-6-methylguanine DNA methyltransferase
MNAWHCTIATPDGQFTAWFTRRGLAGLNFPGAEPACPPTRSDGLPPLLIGPWQGLTMLAVNEVLAGHRPKKLPPLDWSGATDFQRDVWEELQRIRPGRTRTYAEIAAAIGKPKAARAVGAACGANPIPLLVPCHRVLAAGGKLGGFSGGLPWKELLLKREGVVLESLQARNVPRPSGT